MTCSDVRSGAFKKWTMEYNADVTKIDIYLCLVFSRAPRTSPRKNISSIMGTVSEAATTLEKASQLIAPRREKIGDASKIAPQQSRGIAEKTKPVSKSRRQRGFAASCKSFRLQILSDRMSGQSKITAATSSARWKKVSKSYCTRKVSKP